MEPLPKAAVQRVVEGKGKAERVPLMVHFWVFPEVFGPQEGALRSLLARYPCDIEKVELGFPDIRYASSPPGLYAWNTDPLPDAVGHQAYDNRVVLAEWDGLDAFIAQMPSPEEPGLIPAAPPNDGRYRLAVWWGCLFERLWGLRGMENALMDLCLYPDEVHRLFEALTRFYIRAMERAKFELGADGIFTSDDLGTQTGPFFSPGTFRELFKPYYKRLIDKAHELGMHFWLHTCGNVEPLLPDFVELGLDVIHPIQKYTMDDAAVAAEFGDKLAICYGFDVQQTIPYGSAEDVRREVRRAFDVYRRQDGRFLLTMGNGSTADWPLESLEALFEEALAYGRSNDG